MLNVIDEDSLYSSLNNENEAHAAEDHCYAPFEVSNSPHGSDGSTPSSSTIDSDYCSPGASYHSPEYNDIKFMDFKVEDVSFEEPKVTRVQTKKVARISQPNRRLSFSKFLVYLLLFMLD